MKRATCLQALRAIAGAALALLLACGSSSTSDTASAGDTPLCGSNPVASAASPDTLCPQGFADCNHDPSDGCEANVTSDVARCGSCDRVCGSQNATPSCNNGVCALACAAGFADCNGAASDGCETHTDVDPVNCGTCGKGCSTANSIPTCTAGACVLACSPGFGDCDGVQANGCETDTTTSSANCGTCGNVCVSFNGASTCKASLCTLACAAGFGDCDGDPHNGCETDVRTSVNDCGACANKCASIGGSASCAAGACAIQCFPGLADCDGNPANGCESTLASDRANCGVCGKICGSQNAVATCAAGTCTLSCSPGYGDCDGQSGNGCEHDLSSDNNNCGACGNVCQGATTCINNVCR
jgi:hypothetical protein